MLRPKENFYDWDKKSPFLVGFPKKPTIDNNYVHVVNKNFPATPYSISLVTTSKNNRVDTFTMQPKKTLLFTIAMAALALYSTAQVSQPTFSLQHIKSGMSQSSATEIFEDSYGFLWIGTPNGRNRYDGTNFRVFEKGHDGVDWLTDGYVEKIYEDVAGTLYVGTNQGLNQYDRCLNSIVPYPFKPEAQFLLSKYFGAIFVTNYYLLLGSYNCGVYRYDI